MTPLHRTLLLPSLALALLFGPASAGASTDGDGADFSPEISRAAERGLEWLASRQLESGAWEADVGYKLRTSYQVREAQAPHVGVTALAAMAFLAGGHLPGRGPYGDVLDRAVRYLMGSVSDLGFATGNHTRMYSHAFATLLLAEVYGTTDIPELRQKLQHTVDLIVASQNDRGSWRYEPFVTESDMSITVCQLMALRAARNVGIRVPASTIESAVAYVRRSEVRDVGFRSGNFRGESYYFHEPGCFRYQVEDDERSSFALTAAGIVSLYHAGHYDARSLSRSLYVLREARPRLSRGYQGHFFYWYGHYYAVQAAFLTSSEIPGYWEEYFRAVSRELLDAQKRDGSWPNPIGPGPTFGTAVACIILQVPARYLPILQR